MEETVTNQEQVTSFKPVRKRSEKQIAWSKKLGKQSQTLKKKKKERLEQDLHNQLSKADVATIEEIEEVKEIEIVKDKKYDMAFIGLILVAIIDCGAYCMYSRKAQSLTAKADTPDVQPKEKVELVKSGIIDME